jgi:glycogen phosphorylase
MPKPKPSQVLHTHHGSRTGFDVENLKRAFADHLFFGQARFPAVATRNDYYLAVAHTVRDRILHRWVHTAQTYFEQESRTVCYLSAEFLLGPHLGNNLITLGACDNVRQALEESGLDLDELMEQEEEPGLGNGGLGRLAACYLDSLASLEIPAIGYGIRYEFGIFDQEIRDGWQVEVTDKWLSLGNPWEIARPEVSFNVKLRGHTEYYYDDEKRFRVRWVPEREVKGIGYDTPVVGYRTNTANMLRLWQAEAVESFDFSAYNLGDYYGAVTQKIKSENLTKILYPNDEAVEGKKLRLEQQYFFVSCSLQDMVRLYLQKNQDLRGFHEKYVIQLNDTHPSIAVAELMRLFLDEHHMDWDEAWNICRQTFAYTNHTLLPEALEKWPLDLFAYVLPRHLEIIHEINWRFLEEVRLKYPGDNEQAAALSIIDEQGERYVRMAHLACVGSYAINGVAELHSQLLKSTILKDFYALWPEKFHNITNGVTPRRFLVLANRELANFISTHIGNDWIKDLNKLRQLEKFSEEPEFCTRWQAIKANNKIALADCIQRRIGIKVDPQSMFDVHVKRIHEYKRQHLNILHIITLYNRLKNDANLELTPRTFIFAGKAAPGYGMAKLIIKLINEVGNIVNRDPAVRNQLKVVFLPNFNVKNAQRIYPAADLSEQISTAGKEASGTGNMKFALNGALTIGTLDGANIEIREEVGADNFFLFGLTAEQVAARKEHGYYPRDYYHTNEELKAALDLISSGFFSHGDGGLYAPLVNSLLKRDDYMVLADYAAYINCQEQVDQAYRDSSRWTRMSILNSARIGKFSSDRAIREYAEKIWHVDTVPINLER